MSAPILILWVFEAALRLSGFNHFIPFLYEPLFEKIDQGKFVQTPKHLKNFDPYDYPFVIPQGPLAVKKDSNKFRVIVVGDSTVVGFPQKEFMNCAQSKLQKEIEFINMGFMGCGSTRALHSLIEAINLQPDLIFLYTGHSEFVDHCNLRTLSQQNLGPHPGVIWGLKHTRTAKFLWWASMKLIPHKREWAKRLRPIFNEEQKIKVYQETKMNFQQMFSLAKQAKIPLIVSTLVYNYFEEPDHQHLNDLNKLDLGFMNQQAVSKVEYLEALKHYQVKDFAQAKYYFELALQKAVSPNRASLTVNKIISEEAKKQNVPLIDLKKILDLKAADSILSYQLFTDNCHLNSEGRAILAEQFCLAL